MSFHLERKLIAFEIRMRIKPKYIFISMIRTLLIKLFLTKMKA